MEETKVLADLQEILTNSTEEEKEILRLAMQAIRQRRESGRAYPSGFLGLDGRFVDERTYQFIVPITPYMLNELGIVHGGISATLVDCTIGSLVNLSLPQGEYAVTTELKVNYIRPGKGKALRSEATIIHRGRTLVICEGKVFDDQEQLIVHATGTFMILQRDRD
jgi:uncharacterized protein (TIGR00369 family)